MKTIIQIIISKIGLLLGIFIIPVATSAQQPATKLSLSLARARTIALSNNPEILANSIDARINKEKIAEARMKRIPQVYADYNIQRNLIIPVTPVPANAFNPNAPQGEIIPLRFATKWTSNTGINANYDLFNPQKKQAIQEAEIKDKLNQIENEYESATLSFDVSKAYLESLIAAEQLKLAVLDTLTKASILKVLKQQFDNGRLLLPSLNKAKADLNSVLNNWEEAKMIFTDSKRQLLYLLGYPPDDTIEVEFEDTIEELLNSSKLVGDTSLLNSYADNKFTQNTALLNTQIKGTLNGYLPSIVLKGYYGANFFDNGFDLLKSTNWNGNSFINLGIRVPITEGLERQKKISQLRLQIEADQLRYRAEKNKNKLDLLSAETEAQMLQRNYSRALDNYKLAEQNVAIAQQQFENGRLLITDLYQVIQQQQQDKNTYLNTAYNYMLVMLNLEKLRRN